MHNIQEKLLSLAQMIDGQIITNDKGMEVCVKGIVAGFPVTAEAIKATYPFGTNYFLETGSFSNQQLTPESFKLTIVSRYMPGWLTLFSRILFFESPGQKLDVPMLDKTLRSKYNNAPAAKRFAQYPGVAENILQLEKISHFNEMLVNSSAGIYISQPKAFLGLDPALCKEIFIIMAELGQVLFEAF